MALPIYIRINHNAKTNFNALNCSITKKACDKCDLIRHLIIYYIIFGA